MSVLRETHEAGRYHYDYDYDDHDHDKSATAVTVAFTVSWFIIMKAIDLFFLST